MAWPWEIIERDHELQNPTSADKIRLLGNYLRLTPESRVLDVACGKGGPATILAAEYGCRISGVEIRAAFADEARRRVAELRLESRVDIRTGDAAELELEPGAWDAGLCLGAGFVWGTIGDAAAALRPGVRPGGSVAIGEPYWRQWPVPDGVDAEYFVSLEATVARLVEQGFALTGLIASSDDDWDRYESLHWRAAEELLTASPEHPDAAEIRATHERRRGEYIRDGRSLLGWAIFVGRKM